MFERYTESARRAVFFARYEAGFDSNSDISTVDLLRGVVRESKPEAQGIEWIRVNMDRLSGALWPSGTERQERPPANTEIALSDDAKRALAYAAVAGESNPRGTIDAATLLLGLLSFENESARLLQKLGLTLESARGEVRRLHKKYPPQLPSRISLAKGVVRRNRTRLLKILIFLLVVLGGVALVNWINR